MSSSLNLPVIAGFASGIALIVIFSFSTTLLDHQSNETSVVLIAEGSSLESNPSFFVPDVIKVGAVFGALQSQEVQGSFLMEGDSYEFTFREAGELRYHGEPHLWMQGTVIVLPA